MPSEDGGDSARIEGTMELSGAWRTGSTLTRDWWREWLDAANAQVDLALLPSAPPQVQHLVAGGRAALEWLVEHGVFPSMESREPTRDNLRAQQRELRRFCALVRMPRGGGRRCAAALELRAVGSWPVSAPQVSERLWPILLGGCVDWQIEKGRERSDPRPRPRADAPPEYVPRPDDLPAPPLVVPTAGTVLADPMLDVAHAILFDRPSSALGGRRWYPYDIANECPQRVRQQRRSRIQLFRAMVAVAVHLDQLRVAPHGQSATSMRRETGTGARNWYLAASSIEQAVASAIRSVRADGPTDARTTRDLNRYAGAALWALVQLMTVMGPDGRDAARSIVLRRVAPWRAMRRTGHVSEELRARERCWIDGWLTVRNWADETRSDDAER